MAGSNVIVVLNGSEISDRAAGLVELTERFAWDVLAAHFHRAHDEALKCHGARIAEELRLLTCISRAPHVRPSSSQHRNGVYFRHG